MQGPATNEALAGEREWFGAVHATLALAFALFRSSQEGDTVVGHIDHALIAQRTSGHVAGQIFDHLFWISSTCGWGLYEHVPVDRFKLGKERLLLCLARERRDATAQLQLPPVQQSTKDTDIVSAERLTKLFVAAEIRLSATTMPWMLRLCPAIAVERWVDARDQSVNVRMMI